MCFHKWSKWEKVKENDLYIGKINRLLGIHLIQKKTCLKCNLIEIREVKP